MFSLTIRPKNAPAEASTWKVQWWRMWQREDGLWAIDPDKEWDTGRIPITEEIHLTNVSSEAYLNVYTFAADGTFLKEYTYFVGITHWAVPQLPDGLYEYPPAVDGGIYEFDFTTGMLALVPPEEKMGCLPIVAAGVVIVVSLIAGIILLL